MRALINACLARTRTVMSLLVLLLISGAVAYNDIPKESDPDVAIPILYITMKHDGISPEDAERLLVRPMEQELRSIEGLKEMRATAEEGFATVVLEFEAGFDVEKAKRDVREQMDIAKVELPGETEEPELNEVNVALFPILVVTLSGDVDERLLIRLGRDLKDKIAALPGVLEVDVAGDREDLAEIVVDPRALDSYGISQDELVQLVGRNNQLVPAGALDSDAGRVSIKVPGLIQSVDDILDMPVKAVDGRVVTFRDIAVGQRGFKDPASIARVDGRPAIALEVTKRIGVNIIDTIDEVRALAEAESALYPDGVEVSYSQDKSEQIKIMLSDLSSNVASAIILVMIVVLAALGLRSAILVGIAIPGSFLTGMLVLSSMGLTVNIVVLFALILAVGMLVDGAIVVTEYADRRMLEGAHRVTAYREASNRMAWPIISSTATTLAAFLPLLFWPGIVGEFMKYLPITLIVTLTASLAMALVFVPVTGSIIGKPTAGSSRVAEMMQAAEEGDIRSVGGMAGLYVRTLDKAVRYPWVVIAIAITTAVLVFTAYGTFGRGIEFFPKVEPDNAQVQIRARGNMSIQEKDALVREVEAEVLELDGFKTVYTRTGTIRGEDFPADTIGIITLEFADWRTRPHASEILQTIRERTAEHPGLVVEAREEESGPPVGKVIQIELSSRTPEALPDAVEHVLKGLNAVGGLIDIADSRPVPGIEWEMVVDRAQASRFGADVMGVGNAVRFVTQGVNVGTYRPDDTDDEVEIRVRFPEVDRTGDRLDQLRVQTAMGQTPISNFVIRRAAPTQGTIERVDARRVLTVDADVPDGVLPDNKMRKIRAWIAANPLDPQVEIAYKGEDEEQRAAQEFLSRAFGIALFLIAIILVTQFNSFYQTALVLSAVVFSSLGVLIGMMATAQPFGIVMAGIGLIALAGIVVNNNIVLIDTYNEIRARGVGAVEAALRTGAQRLRPVILTTVTTMLGLVPMMLSVNVDIPNRVIAVGAPSTQWWTQLSTAIVYGLGFATLLTLILTPSMLVLGDRVGAWARRIIRREPRPAA
ncbi:multidrug resistance protein [Tistrella bauzanensis]|uniref:Multidrug resistance protein n=1 Tax=Tistrella bauzanensis TaxID=657419 RepID=A0ABQ1I9W8_9PROT|nr:efflux RND transporter permease subunit [Tistrella bauzanensis]GGB25458.1 multidrug resistance protein [Tistrella bauzanensis]